MRKPLKKTLAFILVLALAASLLGGMAFAESGEYFDLNVEQTDGTTVKLTVTAAKAFSVGTLNLNFTVPEGFTYVAGSGSSTKLSANGNAAFTTSLSWFTTTNANVNFAAGDVIWECSYAKESAISTADYVFGVKCISACDANTFGETAVKGDTVEKNVSLEDKTAASSVVLTVGELTAERTVTLTMVVNEDVTGIHDFSLTVTPSSDKIKFKSATSTKFTAGRYGTVTAENGVFAWNVDPEDSRENMNVSAGATWAVFTYEVDEDIATGTYSFSMAIKTNPADIEGEQTTFNNTTVTASFTVEGSTHTHTLTKVAAKAATCSATGNKEYWECSDCGKLFLDDAGNQETTLDNVTIAKDDNAHNYVNGECTLCGKKQPAYQLYVVVDKTTDTDGDGYYDVDPGDTVKADVYIKADSDVQLQAIWFKLTANDKLTAGNASFDDFTLRNGIYYNYGTKVFNLTANTALKLGTITYTVGEAAEYDEQLGITLSDAYVTAYRGTEQICAAVAGTGVEIATTYIITWNINGATETTEVPYGKMPTHDTPERKGYTFVGWNPEITAATANTTYTAQWTRNFDFVTEEYRYAGEGQVLLILKADAPENGKCYTYGGEPMFYTEDQYYRSSLNSDTGVYVYLIPAADVTDDTAAGKIAVSTGTNATVTRGGDVNSDTTTTIADASIVYRMLQEGGSVYNTLSIKQRLEADVSTDIEGATARGSIADVDAIVEIYFAA